MNCDPVKVLSPNNLPTIVQALEGSFRTKFAIDHTKRICVVKHGKERPSNLKKTIRRRTKAADI